MQRFMVKLGVQLQSHRKLVIGLWVVALLVSVPFAAHQTDHLTGGGFEDPHSQSTAVSRAVLRAFPSVSNAHLAIVLVPRRNANRQDFRHAILSVNREISNLKDVKMDAEGREVALLSTKISPKQTVIIQLDFAGNEQRAADLAMDIRAKLGISGGRAGRAAGGRVEVHLVGQGAVLAAFQQQAKTDSSTATARALPVIAIVLLLAFGSLAGVALPLGLGITAVTITGALIYALSHVTTISLYVTSVATLIGLGVAVDYSLFVLARYREEARGGRSPKEARSVAMGTSGVAVVFSGFTVITSLLGMFIIDSTAPRSIAAGAMIVVAVSVLAASTLMPVLIGLLGHRAHEPGRLSKAIGPRIVRRRSTPEQPFWERWANRVMKHPVRFTFVAAAVLLLLAGSCDQDASS